MKKISLPKLIIVIILKLLSISAIILGLYLFFITPRTVLCYDCNLDFQWINPFKSYEIEDASLNLIRSSGLLIILFGISLFFGGIYISKRKKWTGLLSLIFFLLILCSFLLPNGPKPSPISSITKQPITDWKTYQAYNFQIKYPKDWIIDEVNQPRQYVIKSPDYERKIFEIKEGGSYPVIMDGLMIIIGAGAKEREGIVVSKPEGQAITFKGKNALIYKLFYYHTFTTADPVESMIGLRIEMENYNVDLQVISSAKYNEESLESFFDQILSTFEFTQ